MKVSNRLLLLVFSALFFTQCLKETTSQQDIDRQAIEEYLEANQISGATEDPNGIFSIIDLPGTAGSPTINEPVKIRYQGFLLDGQKVDESPTDSSVTFPLNNSIVGWQLSIIKLQRGGQGRFWIPSYLAFGNQAIGNVIPANSVLYYEIELLDFGQTLIEAQKQQDRSLILADLNSQQIENFVEDTSGIFYVLEVEGEGDHPSLERTVTVSYEGFLLDGTRFDGTQNGQTVNFRLNGLIPGWQIAIPKLKKGGKGRFWIPSHQGYGLDGSGNTIPPNSVLVFDIELVDFF